MIDSKVYSIGYTAFKINDFINTLQKFGIQCIVDVRSNPVSQHYEDYNRDVLRATLNVNDILYKNYAKEFGARQNSTRFYNKEGYLDFSIFTKSDQFNEGIEKIKKGIELGYTFCLMCAETDPINCHRSIMVGKGFAEHGIIVNHIQKNNKIQTQRELELRLLDLYFKDRDQLTMFSEIKSDEEMILEAYKMKNKEIGFRKADE